MNIQRIVRTAMWILFFFMIFSFFSNMQEASKTQQPSKVTYSQFLSQVDNDYVEAVVVVQGPAETFIKFKRRGDSIRYETQAFHNDPGLIGDLVKKGILFDIQSPYKLPWLLQILINWFPILLLIGVWFYFVNKQGAGMGGGGGGIHPFGKSKARMLENSQNNTTFDDVAGIEEAKEEVQELVEFLSNPSKFQKLGGKIPRGVLLTGAPGTGKTLLARAIAGEAKVPFFNISGSDFVEMFVGVGASRVRAMFEQAKKHAPCIIFIDEIDAVGRQRGAGLGGGHDEREQTLNQLLVELDGFEENDGVIVIAATNRPDVLDPALLRPGRFDRQVVVPFPDMKGREKILQIHAKNVPCGDDVDLGIIARSVPGFTGADLENLINEAALFAARSNKEEVSMEDFERAKDKVIMGAERRSIVMPEEELKNTAYHEIGHTVVAKTLPNTDPVHKVTIIPRGRALGVTMQLPEEDRYSQNREMILSTIAVLMGGRIAEEMFMGQMTTGAANDFERATDLARKMVTRWGMSDKLGHIIYAENEGSVFLGRELSTHKNLSDSTTEEVDKEIRRIVEGQYKRAQKVLEDKKVIVENMTQALLEWETLNADQINMIMEGKEIVAPGAEPQELTDS